jgi:hypothetical protein
MDNFSYNRAIFGSSLSTNAKITGLAIASHYNWKTGDMAYPSISTLCKSTGLSKASIHRAKIELVSQGYLVSERRFNNSNLYLPQIPAGLTETLGSLSLRDTQSHTEELKDNIKDNRKDNLKDNNERASGESLSDKDINSFDILFNYIEGESNEKRTDPASAAGGSNKNTRRMYRNPGFYNTSNAKEPRVSKGDAHAAEVDWMG